MLGRVKCDLALSNGSGERDQIVKSCMITHKHTHICHCYITAVSQSIRCLQVGVNFAVRVKVCVYYTVYTHPSQGSMRIRSEILHHIYIHRTGPLADAKNKNPKPIAC